MTQEELKQRLIELIASKVCDEYSPACDEWQPHDCGKCYANNCHIADIATHLLSNGVTIREDEKPTEDGTTIRAKNIKFNTGDYARIVDNESGHYFAIGTIVQLEKHETDYLATNVNGCNWWVVDNELESADVADWAGVKDA